MHTSRAEPPPRSLDIRILAGLARGRSYARIALDLELPHDVVLAHVPQLCRRMGARSTAHAIALAYGHGWMKGLRREPRRGVVLSAQQLTVLACVAQGLTPEQIARRLGIHLSAVTDCMERTCARLRAHDRHHAIALAIQHGHVTAPQS